MRDERGMRGTEEAGEGWRRTERGGGTGEGRMMPERTEKVEERWRRPRRNGRGRRRTCVAGEGLRGKEEC